MAANNELRNYELKSRCGQTGRLADYSVLNAATGSIRVARRAGA
jgi:hypothetical protein